MNTGYSKKSLVEKLGIKAGIKMIVLDPPKDYHKILGALPKDVIQAKTLNGPLDLIHFFTKSKDELGNKFPSLKKSLSPSGALWISWPKGSSKVDTDLNENIVREIALNNGLVDVKVCAIDEVWSGLKLVYRLKDRSK